MPKEVKKPVVKKALVKPAVKASVKRQAKVTAPKAGGLSVPVFSLVGKSAGTFTLPKEIFGVKINESLLNQAIRVYMNNQKGHFGNTKTRGEVEGSTRKIFKQKGTGKARHGSIRANIFVGGGIVFGPKTRKVILDLPQKMKKAALLSALSLKAKNGEVRAISGLEKATGKTKEMATLLKGIETKSALFLTGGKDDLAVRGVKNIKGIDVLGADKVNVLEVVAHESLILTKEAVEKLEEKFSLKKDAK